MIKYIWQNNIFLFASCFYNTKNSFEISQG